MSNDYCGEAFPGTQKGNGGRFAVAPACTLAVGHDGPHRDQTFKDVTWPSAPVAGPADAPRECPTCKRDTVGPTPCSNPWHLLAAGYTIREGVVSGPADAVKPEWAILNRQADYDAAMDWCAANPVPQRVIDDAMLDLSALGLNSREPGMLMALLRKIIGLSMYRATARASVEAQEDRDHKRMDWLDGQNAIVRGDSPILPPSCGYSVRAYIDQRITDEAIPRATSSGQRSPNGETK